MTTDEHRLSNDNTMLCAVSRIDVVGAAEVAEMLGITRQRVDALVRSHGSFPKPAATIAAGRIWLRRDIEDWAAASGRLVFGVSNRRSVERGARSHGE